MAEQSPAQPEQPEKVPPDEPEPVAPAPESEPGGPLENIVPTPPGENSDQPSQLSSAEPPTESPQYDEHPLETSENFPAPFDEDIGYEIVEPPEGEESDDGFASIPPGPTEEVSFEPPRVRGLRRRRDRGRREAARAGAPAPEREPPTKPFSIWLAVAGVALLAAIIAVVVLLILHARQP
jgi:hypothetical protein